MTSESQASDRLREVLQRAKERSAGTAPAPPAQEPPQAEASVESLLDRNQPLPDPRALSRLYQEQALTVRLPDTIETDAEAPAAPRTATPGWGDLPAPAPLPRPGGPEEAPPPPVWAEQEAQSSQLAQPPLSAGELRGVMQKLQSDFGGTYALYEIPKEPSDDFGARTVQEEWDRELAELKRLADESAQSNWVFVLGAVVVVVILGAFIYLAAVGPLKPPTPVPTPSATAPAAHL